MPSMQIDPGSGSTQNPINLTTIPDRVNGENPSSDWWTKYISSYNKPINLPDTNFFTRQRAARQTAEMLAESQRKSEEAARAQTQGTVGYATPADAARAEAMAAEENAPTPGQQVLSWIGSNWQETLMGSGRYAKLQEAEKRDADIASGALLASRGPEKPGYIQQAVMDQSGNIIGYKYVQLQQPKMVTAADQTAATQNGALTPANQKNPTIYDEVASLESSFSTRRYEAAVRMWGEPVTNPDTGELDWSQGGKSYLGMAPGEVGVPMLQAPAEDAPYKDWVKYRDRLKAQQNILNRQPYTESDVKRVYYNMGTAGIKRTQMIFRDLGFYDSRDLISFGNIGEKELGFMTRLMTDANINGTTWEEQLAMKADAVQERAGRGGSGSGSGSGSSGTSVYTQVQYTQTSMAQGRALLVSVLKDALGRYPTDDEISRFIDMLNKAESKSPTTTVTRTTKSGGVSRSVARTTPSEVDSQQMAKEFAQSIGGGKPYEANKRDQYLMGFLNSLGGRIG